MLHGCLKWYHEFDNVALIGENVEMNSYMALLKIVNKHSSEPYFWTWYKMQPCNT